MTRLAIFLEEESARQMLRGLLPRVIPPQVADAVRYFVYRGKSDMRKNLLKDLRPYRGTDAFCIILHDQDMADCRQLKADLQEICATAGVPAVVRIACRELESWYLAQLDVVERVFGIAGLGRQQEKKKFRAPDKLATPDLLLKELTRMAYAKLSGSRDLGRHLDPDNTRSPSFSHFVRTLRAR